MLLDNRFEDFLCLFNKSNAAGSFFAESSVKPTISVKTIAESFRFWIIVHQNFLVYDNYWLITMAATIIPPKLAIISFKLNNHSFLFDHLILLAIQQKS